MKPQKLGQISKQKIQSQTARRITSGLICLLVVILLISWQTLTLAQPVSQRSNSRVVSNGDIEELEYASVHLDGNFLFEIGAPRTLPSESEPDGSLSPIEIRVQRIEGTLKSIIKTGFDPKSFTVNTSILNGLTVIVASDQKFLTRRVIVTVTDIDARITSSSIDDLAGQWSRIIKSALIQARQARQPEARKRQVAIVAAMILGMIITSCLLSWRQKVLKSRFYELNKRYQKQYSTSLELDSLSSEPDSLLSELDSLSSSFENEEFFSTPLEVLSTLKFHKKANLEERLTLNILLRQLLRIGQTLLWFSGIVGILFVFPETRLEGRSFIFIPLKILFIWFVLSLMNSLVIIYLNNQLRAWAEDGSVIPEYSQRRILRAPTLLEVSRGMIKFVSLAIGTIWFLTWQELPLSWLTGAGLLGAALTFVFQNLLKDWINGILIIFEDQYIVGDMVDIGGFRGIVEQMSLRATQIRGFKGGSFSTIPHNQITIVHNLSKDWAQVNFTIEVAYQTDITAALEVMKQVAQHMADDPHWQQDIIDPVSLIGVDRVAHSGIELMMWIKVKRLRQWAVEREFRRRLKLTFDEQGIQIGVPRQNLSFHENTASKFSPVNGQYNE